jgi:hypothetical protein
MPPLPVIDVESVKCPSCGRWCKVEEEQIEQAKVERLIALLAERAMGRGSAGGGIGRMDSANGA